MPVAFTEIDRLSPTRRPSGPVAGFQHWRELLFLHWRISPAEIAARVPEALSVDTCEGSAWIGLVLFRMSGVRPWWSPAIPGVSAFPETNVRTYVHFQGHDPGVWFLSLDAASTLGVQIGRQRWGLPYHRSQMAVRRRGDFIQYKCEREWPGRMGVGGLVEAEIGDVYSGLDRNLKAGCAVPGSLEHFLIERYLLYAQKNNRISIGQVHHSPYPLREARLRTCEQSWLDDVGLSAHRPPDHILFSEGVATEIFPLRPAVMDTGVISRAFRERAWRENP
jgi:uncharacterized protein YqjF (DUF2071 family)